MTDGLREHEASTTDGDGETFFDDVEQWVDEWLLPTYRRHLSRHERVWCRRWREHPEVVHRLTGVWLAWEGSRGADVSRWWREDLDYHMGVITSLGGPFRSCGADGDRHGTAEPPPFPSEGA